MWGRGATRPAALDTRIEPAKSDFFFDPKRTPNLAHINNLAHIAWLPILVAHPRWQKAAGIDTTRGRVSSAIDTRQSILSTATINETEHPRSMRQSVSKATLNYATIDDSFLCVTWFEGGDEVPFTWIVRCKWVVSRIGLRLLCIRLQKGHCNAICVTRMNESCHTYKYVMSDIWMSHVTHMNESWQTYESVMAHIWMSHGAHMNESWHICEGVSGDLAYINKSGHKYEQRYIIHQPPSHQRVREWTAYIPLSYQGNLQAVCC